MNKLQLSKWVKYSQDLKARLSDKLPEKHKHRPTQYKEFLQREIKAVDKKIEDAIMSGVKA